MVSNRVQKTEGSTSEKEVVRESTLPVCILLEVSITNRR